jgi:hypothetical protein
MRSYCFFSRFTSPIKWLLVRLPRGFSIPFIIICVWWMFNGFDYINDPIALRLQKAVTNTTKFAGPHQRGDQGLCGLPAKVVCRIHDRYPRSVELQRAAVAFQVIYEETLDLLRNFDFDQPQDKVQVALISRAGRVNREDKF